MSSEDYFELKYNEEINELFNGFKGILDHYQVHYEENNHMDFLYFIMNSITIHYNDECDSSDEETHVYEKKYKI